MDWPPLDRYMHSKCQLKELGPDLCGHVAFTGCVVLRGVCSSLGGSEKQGMIVKVVCSLQRPQGFLVLQTRVRPHARLVAVVKKNTPKKQGEEG